METSMTIESFFLNDYVKLKEENNELKQEIYNYNDQIINAEVDCGFTDLHSPITLVLVEIENSHYSLFQSNDSEFKAYTSQELQELLNMSDADLEKKLKTTHHSFYARNLLTIKTKKFPFTLKFKSYKGEVVYAYDPDGHRTELIDFANKPAVDQWVEVEFKQQSIEYALQMFREAVTERIDELNIESEQ